MNVRPYRRVIQTAGLAFVLVLSTPPLAPAAVTVVQPPYTFRAFRWEQQQVRVVSFIGSPSVSLQMVLAGPTFGFRRTTSRIGTRAGGLAAINGGFVASSSGAPRHLTVVNGEIITSGAMWTQPGIVLMVTGDRTEAWIHRPRFHVTASTRHERFAIVSWNARQPWRSKVVAFTARGGDEVAPAVQSCWALLEPVRGVRTASRTYRVAQVRKGPGCDRAPIEPPARRFDWVVIGGRPVKALETGERLNMRVDLGHPGVTDVFGGLPQLVDDGINVGPACFSTCGPKHGPDRPFYARNPRSAIGISIGCSDKDPLTLCRYFLVTVDGRQPGWSTGLRFPDLARLMIQLGAWNAVNLDGGGSTTMWLRHRNKACQHRTEVGCLVNRPPYGERAVINAVVLGTS